MSKLERYNYEEAYNESAKMREKIEGGEAGDYVEAEKAVDAQKAKTEQFETELSPEAIEMIMAKVQDLRRSKGELAIHNTNLAGFENIFDKYGKFHDGYVFLCAWVLGYSGSIDKPDWSTMKKGRDKKDDDYEHLGEWQRLKKTQQFVFENKGMVLEDDYNYVFEHPYLGLVSEIPYKKMTTKEIQKELIREEQGKEDKRTIEILNKYENTRKYSEIYDTQQHILNHNNKTIPRKIEYQNLSDEERKNPETADLYQVKIISDPEHDYIRSHPLTSNNINDIKNQDMSTLRILKMAKKTVDRESYAFFAGYLGVIIDKFRDIKKDWNETEAFFSPDRYQGVILYKSSPALLDNLVKIMVRFAKNPKFKQDDCLVPIYSLGGQLLWPKKMSHGEIKKFIKERDKDKK